MMPTMCNMNIMERHYARLVELSQVEDGWTFGEGKVPNQGVFLDAMYLVSLCYIHNVKIKEIFLLNERLGISFDGNDELYFYLYNNESYCKKNFSTNRYFDFKREDLKNIFLDQFLPMPNKG